MMVVTGHGAQFGFVGPMPAHVPAYGVLLFFVLSGFLMGALYLPKEPTASSTFGYAVSRTARILPIYIAVVLASFIYYQLVDPGFVYAISGKQLLRLLTFNGSVSVFWSIGPEMQFYAVFVLFWLIYARSKMAFFVIVPLAALACLLTISVWPGIFVLSKLHIFTLGVLIAALRPASLPTRVIKALHILSIVLLIGIIASTGFSDLLGPTNVHNDPKNIAFYGNVPGLLVIGIIVFSFTYESRLGVIVFANWFMVLLGTVSFSLYLLHEPVIYFLGRAAIVQNLGQYLATAVMFALSIAVSWMSYMLVERPARSFFKNVSAQQRSKIPEILSTHPSRAVENHGAKYAPPAG